MRTLHAHTLLAFVVPLAAFELKVLPSRVTLTIHSANHANSISEFVQSGNVAWLEASKSPGLTGLTALYDSTFTLGREPAKETAVAEQPEAKASEDDSSLLEKRCVPLCKVDEP